ncbi:hypothetical protein B0I12_001643 [Microbacterium hydrothermale]|uniref:hypothetical protein n=1 Tax=Microbacterium hydrothermale TaxID=857427 RepID=UPI002226A5B2|nr:hypothetical protein [Microbacterium hydrothermale]MCW2164508.1 hypothetical protein [Microbacterium hydrothermale]
MNAPGRPLALSLMLAAVLAATTACIPLPSPLDRGDAAEAPSSVATEAPSTAPGDEATVDPDDYSDVFAERDEFFRAQQLPMDGTPLVAVTPAQKDFIAQQQAYVEQQGLSWTASDENLALALAGDACETAILSRHRVDSSTLIAHVTTSPLFAQLIPADLEGDARTTAEAPIASVMVFGTTFLCPEDGDQWVAAYREVYGG